MPRTSYRQQFLQELKEAIETLILVEMHMIHFTPSGSSTSSVDLLHSTNILLQVLSRPSVDGALRFYIAALQQRYLLPRTVRERPINKFRIDLNPFPVNGESLPWLTDVEFLSAYRMSRQAFHRLVGIIKHHKVFQASRRGSRQFPVEQQLLTLLHYLSVPASSASGARTRNHFHISYGAKDLYVNRCVEAIRSCMRARYYTWPDADERKELAKQFKKNYKLPNAILVVDGTTFPLMQRPNREDAADYSGRKEGYTITNLFFSDMRRRIRYYVIGWAGCSHDNRLWTNCKVYREPMSHFSPGQYLIGDSAFANGPHMITTYRAPTGGVVEGGNKRFNDLLSSPRVVSEHVNGILKGRWCWLNCIPCDLTEDPKSMERILKLIDVIVILHNFLIEENFTGDDDMFYEIGAGDNDSEVSELDPDDELNQGVAAGAHNGYRREQLRAYLSEKCLI